MNSKKKQTASCNNTCRSNNIVNKALIGMETVDVCGSKDGFRQFNLAEYIILTRFLTISNHYHCTLSIVTKPKVIAHCIC